MLCHRPKSIKLTGRGVSPANPHIKSLIPVYTNVLVASVQSKQFNPTWKEIKRKTEYSPLWRCWEVWKYIYKVPVQGVWEWCKRLVRRRIEKCMVVVKIFLCLFQRLSLCVELGSKAREGGCRRGWWLRLCRCGSGKGSSGGCFVKDLYAFQLL